MVKDSSELSDQRVSAHGEHVTYAQLELIISYFGRHAISVMGVSVDYDTVTETLDLSGIPTPDATAERAEVALRDAIAAAQYLRPSTDMDISA
jgi:hypothetical protein